MAFQAKKFSLCFMESYSMICCSEFLRSQYGEYYLAQLISGEQSNSLSIVAEVDGKAKGLMILTKDVDVKILQTCFKLRPYDNLNFAPLTGTKNCTDGWFSITICLGVDVEKQSATIETVFNLVRDSEDGKVFNSKQNEYGNK